MTRLVTLALCLLTAPAAAAAGSVAPTCVRDGDRFGCAWSETQAIDLRLPIHPAESPVPACIDCAPDELPTLDLTCELDIETDGAVTARCHAKGRLRP